MSRNGTPPRPTPPTSRNFPPGKETIKVMNARTGSQLTRWLAYGLTFCLLVALMSGCSDKNPSSSEVAATSGTTTTSTTTTTTSAEGTGSIVGQLTDEQNRPINEPGAKISVNLFLGNAKVGTTDALNNNTFTFTGLGAGYYSIQILDANNIFRTNYLVLEVKANAPTNATVTLSRLPGSTAETVDIYGQVLDSVHNAPLMFASVGFLNAGSDSPVFTTSTWGNGYFLLEKIPSGTWTLQFSKSNYQKVSLTLVVASKSKVTFQNTDITAATTVAKAKGDGTDLTGFNIGKVTLQPSFTTTGGIEGRLRSFNPPYSKLTATTTLWLWHRTVRSGVQAPGVIYAGFTTNNDGYIHIENLPEGWYAFTDVNMIASPVRNTSGEVEDWVLVDNPNTTTASEAAYAGWIQVIPGLTTPLPSSGFEK